MSAQKLLKNTRYSAEFIKGLDHVLRVDPSLAKFVQRSSFAVFELDDQDNYLTNPSAFEYLTRSVIGQQVSGASAAAILKRFRSLCEEKESVYPSPENVLSKSPDDLRGAGLSYRKAEYVRGLATAFRDGILDDATLRNSSDDEVVDALVALKGIGPWTADMFLIFCIRHMDVLAVGDLGVQKGFARYLQDRPELKDELKKVDWSIPLQGMHSPGKSTKALNRKAASSPKKGVSAKLPTSNEMEWMAARFRPYRTIFQLLMWRYADTNTEVFNEKLDKKMEKPEEAAIDGEDEEEQVNGNTKPQIEVQELKEESPEPPETPSRKRRRTRSSVTSV